MKRLLSLMLIVSMLLAGLPGMATAASKQMNNDVPVWTEETVRQYVLDYVEGKSMERLWGYYDLQIRRYMPNETFESLLVDLRFLTGDFVALGSYRSFLEPEHELKTHVVHLCMEKQDLDVYFTHKDKENDWEVMALEFVPAAKEQVDSLDAMLVGSEETTNDYSETIVTIGKSPYQLEGILTMPNSASEASPVPACVLIHDFGALDRDHTLGSTKMFKDLADVMADMDVATIRYDKRAFVYPDAQMETVWDEVVEDALSAIELLKQDARVDQQRIVVIGVGLGAMLTPRIASQSEGAVAGMIVIGGTPETLMEVAYTENKDSVAVLPKEEAEAIKNVVRKISSIKEEKAREVDMFGRNGYYYWEAARYDSIKLIKSMRIPILVTQGKRDPLVDEEDGHEAYKDGLGIYKALYTYEPFRGLNHLLMNDLTVDSNGKPEYSVEAHVDRYAGMRMAQWILNLSAED